MTNRIDLVISQARKGALPALIFFFLFILPFTTSGQRVEPVVDTWRPTHYDVTIALDERLSTITSATTKLDATILKSGVTKINLDFGDLTVDSVMLDDKAARFERRPDYLDVLLPRAAKSNERLTITVNYHGKPKDGLVFATDRDGKASVTGDNWPNRVHQWIPCLDHPSAKATVSFSISAPTREVVVANGGFLGMAQNGANQVWRFHETRAIPAYCMVIVVNEGAKIDATGPTVTPLSFYVPQVDREYAPKGFSSGASAVAFFSETIAPYPYEKLALIVGATKYGGMENSSAIVFGSSLFEKRGNDKLTGHFGIPSRIENVVAHEIAHQWFGDSVTQSTWADLWLSEGFATYFAGLFTEKYEGEEAFRQYMMGAADRYFAYEKRRQAPIHDTETLDLNKLLNENNYEKGAWVLHMLRCRLGDETFFKGLRAYYKAHHEANATTEDLRAELEKASGQNLREFFSRWVYGSGHPVYELSPYSAEFAGAGESVTLILKQLQNGEAFTDPVPVEITTADGAKKRYLFQPAGKLATLSLHFDAAAKTRTIELDPDNTLLKEVVKN